MSRQKILEHLESLGTSDFFDLPRFPPYERPQRCLQEGPRERLAQLLADDLQVSGCLGRKLNYFGVENPLDAAGLAWIVGIAHGRTSPQALVDELFRFVLAESIEVVEIVALDGPAFLARRDLPNQVSAVPFYYPSSDPAAGPSAVALHRYPELRAAVTSGTNFESVALKSVKGSLPTMTSALVRRTRRERKFLMPTDPDPPAYTGPHESLLDALNMLALVSEVSVARVASCFEPSGSEPLREAYVSRMEWATPRLSWDVEILDSTGWERLGALLDRLSALDSVEKGKLRVPLERFGRAKAETRTVDKAIDLGICLEALLLDDLGKTTPPLMPFRLRGSWLLGETPEQRRDLYEQLDYIYELRSIAVHQGVFEQRMWSKGRDPHQALLAGVKLAQRAIAELVLRGRPNWTSLILGVAPGGGSDPNGHPDGHG